jgi:hypothetical protein
MASMLSYFGGAAIKPRRTFERLLVEPKKFAKGFRVMFLTGILFTLTVAALAAAGALLPAPALIPLAPQNYYFFEIFFTAPVFVTAWLLSAGLAHLASLVFGGRGPFKATAAALAYAFAVPAFLMWLPQTVFAGFLLLGMSQEEFMSYTASPGPWQTGAWIYLGLVLLLLLAGAVKAVGVVRKLKGVSALLVGLFAAGVFGVIVGIFIR